MYKIKINNVYGLELKYKQFEDLQNLIGYLAEGASEPVKFEIEYVRKESERNER